MEHIISLIIGLLIGWKAGCWITALSFTQILKELGIKDDQVRKLAKQYNFNPEDDVQPTKPEPEEITIKIEQHEGKLYAFRIENDEFLGQGMSSDELVESLAKRFKNVRFTVPKDMGAELLKHDI
jgi:hypothetical protein